MIKKKMKMKYRNLIITLFMIASLKTTAQKNIDTTIYQFKVENIEGEEFNFDSLRGKKIMIVNTASKCGLTPQYRKLQSLFERYKSKNFIIVGFPANNFLFVQLRIGI